MNELLVYVLFFFFKEKNPTTQPDSTCLKSGWVGLGTVAKFPKIDPTQPELIWLGWVFFSSKPDPTQPLHTPSYVCLTEFRPYNKAWSSYPI